MKKSDSLVSILHWLQDKNFHSQSTLKNEKKLINEGERKVLHLFRSASERVPAYNDFLRKHKINSYSIKTIYDFDKVPATTKENYINKYKLEDRCWDGKMDKMHMISTSSGTTGKPCFWPRNLNTEIEGAYLHELIFKEIFQCNKKKSLFINGFAMGNWIAGTFTSACTNLVAWKEYPLTSMTPGYSLETITELLEEISSKFEQTIITGHTPFLKEIIETARKKGINLKKTKVKLLGTGQGITEKWREYMMRLLKSNDYYHTIINLYGSADAALMGFETPLSIFVQNILSRESKKAKEIFEDKRLPSIYNYDPRLIYFEEKEDELHISKNSGCPLIRYNILDNGGVITHGELSSYFNWNKIKKEFKKELIIFNWKFPFVFLFGREKFMVKIYGANIYSEHVQLALENKTLQPLLSGRCILETGYDEQQNPQLICRIELNVGVEKKQQLPNIIQQIFVEEVRKVNSEYNFVLEKLGDKVKPKIVLYEHGHSQYFPKNKIKKTS